MVERGQRLWQRVALRAGTGGEQQQARMGRQPGMGGARWSEWARALPRQRGHHQSLCKQQSSQRSATLLLLGCTRACRARASSTRRRSACFGWASSSTWPCGPSWSSSPSSGSNSVSLGKQRGLEITLSSCSRRRRLSAYTYLPDLEPTRARSVPHHPHHRLHHGLVQLGGLLQVQPGGGRPAQVHDQQPDAAGRLAGRAAGNDGRQQSLRDSSSCMPACAHPFIGLGRFSLASLPPCKCRTYGQTIYVSRRQSATPPRIRP